MSPYCRCLNHKIPGPHEVGCPLYDAADRQEGSGSSNGAVEEALNRYRREWPKLHAAYTQAEQRVGALEAFLRGRGYHAPGRCDEQGHGMNHWVGDHCLYDCAVLAQP